ncbi:MAG: nitroreductase [Streptosporangiales bacterium]|nr:nitroreductase [Streptosporangiales bacterium]
MDRLLTTTRAVRQRLDLARPVEPEVIQECIRIAIQAPTGGGYTQQWRWLVVTDPVKRARLAELYRDTMRKNGPPSRLEDDPRVAQIANEMGTTPERVARSIHSGVHFADRLQDVPVHVIPCVRRSPSDSDTFEVATMYGSILPAVWSFQLALRARGLGTVLTTMHLPHELEAAALLDIPDDVIQVGLIPVAYYTGRDFRPAVRRPAEEITYWNTWQATRKDG